MAFSTKSARPFPNLHFLLLLLLLTVVSACVSSGHEVLPPARDGKMDLSAWNPDKGGLVKLDGEWDFYWKKLLFPQDFPSMDLPAKTRGFHLPGVWNQLDGSRGQGYATFRLMLKLKDVNGPLYLKIPEMPTAHQLWVNGELISAAGRVSATPEGARPWVIPGIKRIKAAGTSMELVLQVSNFHHKDGGVWRSFELGGDRHLFQLREAPLLFDMFIFGSLLMMGGYHLGLFFLRKTEKAPLYFGVFCLCIGFRSLMVGQRIAYMYFPEAGFELLQKIEFLCLFASCPAFCLFFHHLFPREVNKAFHRIALAVGLAYGAATLAFHVGIYSRLAIGFQLAALGLSGYIFYVAPAVIRRRREGAFLFLCGYVLFFITIINDTLYTHLLVPTRNLIHFGVFLLVLFQAIALSKKFAGAFVRIEDMTEELKKKNQDLLKMDRLKDQFLANTSHELKTPLHGIIGIAESMMDGAAGAADDLQKKNLSMIIASGRRLFGLINDLLDFSRMKQTGGELEMSPVDVKAVVEVVSAISMPLIQHKHLSLTTAIPDSLPLVAADENRLQQILFNLVGNAVKFTPSGEIRIEASLEPDPLGPGRVNITVSDTGIGIAEKDQERIFEEFEQVDGSVAREFRGAGLGLAITRKLVQLHGGDITLKSAPGKGSAFSFPLPVAQHQDAYHPKKQVLERNRLKVSSEESALVETFAPAGVAETSTPLRTVLMVDDEPVNLQVVYNQLTLNGYRVLMAGDGMEALEILADETPDLVLLDVMMPKMNGFEVCAKIRETFDYYDLPVIILTAKNQMSDLITGLKNGANDYLTKPFHKEELLARMDAHIHAKFSVSRLRENIRLKQEIEKRKVLESELKTSHRRLARILDCSEDAVVVADREGTICFWNIGAETLLGYAGDLMMGESLARFLPPLIFQEFLDMASSAKAGEPASIRRNWPVDLISGREGEVIAGEAFVSCFRVQDTDFFTLVLRKVLKAGGPGETAATGFEGDKIEAIESAFKDLYRFFEGRSSGEMQTLRQFSPDLDPVDDTVPENDPGREARELMVAVMELSLDLWEKSFPGKTKIELAEESGIWKAYLDGGTWKTRTLDKYLHISTLPKKPRWREVVRTANFVLKKSKVSASDKEALKERVVRLQEKIRGK